MTPTLPLVFYITYLLLVSFYVAPLFAVPRLFLVLLSALPLPVLSHLHTPPAASTPLHTAIQSGDVKLVERLLSTPDAQTALSKRDELLRTPAQAARDARFPEMVDLLHRHDPDTLPRQGHRDAARATDAVLDATRVGAVYGNAEEALPAVSVLVTTHVEQNGGQGDGFRVLYERVEGCGNEQSGARADKDTRFLIGSLTKQFIGVAILRLQERGSLDARRDVLARWFPRFPRSAEVRLEHLLAHTSGIRNFTEELGWIQEEAPERVEELVDMLGKPGFAFEPGERFAYSNTGYVLLGLVVETVSGLTLDKFLDEEFFRPLGMANTGMTSNHRDGSEGVRVNPFGGLVGFSESFLLPSLRCALLGSRYSKYWNISLLQWARGSGAMFSTARDLARWNHALFVERTVLPQELLTQFLTPPLMNDGTSFADYGYGICVERQNESFGVAPYSHDGSILGYTSVSYFLLEPKLSIIVLANASSGRRAAWWIGRRVYIAWACGLRRAMRAPPPPVVKDIAFQARLLKFVGTYDFSQHGYGYLSIAESSKGDHLPLVASGDMLHGGLLAPVSDTVLACRLFHPALLFEVVAFNEREMVSLLKVSRRSPGRKDIIGARADVQRSTGLEASRRLFGWNRSPLRRFAGNYNLGMQDVYIRPGRARYVLVLIGRGYGIPGVPIIFPITLYPTRNPEEFVVDEASLPVPDLPSSLVPRSRIVFSFEEVDSDICICTKFTIHPPGEVPRVASKVS